MSIRFFIVLIALFPMSIGFAFAQSRAVDPSKVAPEFREAAEKRAAEQRKIADCQKVADAQKILARDRSKFVTNCIEK
jgi:hypothetical protein